MNHLATWNHCAIYLHQGDITTLEVDAIVNAANSELLAGGGVCGAIHRKAGKTLAEECAKIIAKRGSIPTGEAVITSGGELPAKYVIHAVGPIYSASPKKAPRLLEATYRNSLSLAREHGLNSIAFPCISTGIYGYPQDEACGIAVAVVRDEVEKHGKLAKVVFCTFGPDDYRFYDAKLSQAAEALD